MIDKRVELAEFDRGLVFGMDPEVQRFVFDDQFVDGLSDRTPNFRAGALAARHAKASLLAAERARLDALQPDPPLIVSDFNLKLNAQGYVGGTSGWTTLVLQQAAQIIDVIVTCKAGTFVLDHFFIGDVDMFLEGPGIEADMFFKETAGRALRFTTLKKKERAMVKFHNKTTDPTPEKIEIKVQVRSYHKREELLPESVE